MKQIKDNSWWFNIKSADKNYSKHKNVISNIKNNVQKSQSKSGNVTFQKLVRKNYVHSYLIEVVLHMSECTAKH